MKRQPSWAALLGRQARLLKQAARPLRERAQAPPGEGSWLMGSVLSARGPRRYWLFRPAGVRFGEKLPLMVMLHGCHQDPKSFAASTRMNALAARERFLVLYPEQPRLANAQGCWNWFDTRSGRAGAEADWILHAVEQVSVFYAADRERTAVAGLSAGASMAALLATRHPQRFKAVAMHSGVPPGVAQSVASAVGAMQGRRVPVDAEQTQDWPPLLVIHGDADGVVSARNADAAAQLWSRATGAQAGEVREQRRGSRYPMRVTQFKRARQVVATLVQVDGLGHAWSGGAARQRFSDAGGPDASRLVWRFAEKQFSAPR
ncbi:PHB depolymerase family esterase [Roseateles asaccharophilus]|uniref:Poly(Hydroxyalkanoate) depolymerase family esterase n=1 Tax=Roseateles asaccharophilus TaxID=582607 RepID=A0ABU2ACX2_9BURK|nr:PHB depolymerase family esterase [Roseateles asaccharophilus]MDR7335056.1 poly(hydroxyalkanoate) depolymerase family esterase [Roseateles asaccharophilus]